MMINTGTMTSGDVGMLRKVTIVALHCCVSRIRRGSFKEKEFYKDQGLPRTPMMTHKLTDGVYKTGNLHF